MESETNENVVALHPSYDVGPSAGPSVAERLRMVMDTDRGVTQSRVARETGLSSPAVSAWMSGTYRADTKGIETKVGRWLTAYQERQLEAKRLPAAPSYVATPTSDRILMALSHTQVTGDVAVIYGGAGLGKTTAIRHYTASGLNVWVATMTPASASVVPALEEIAEAVGLPTNLSGAARLHRAIVKRVNASGGLLVIDEAQHLSTLALDQVRSIHDATGVGLALVGNEQVYARLTGGTRAVYLDRLFSRIGKRLRLTQATLSDVDRLIGAWQVTGGASRSLLVDVARKPGALRGVTKVLRLAAMRAAAADRSIDLEDLEHACRELAPVEFGGES